MRKLSGGGRPVAAVVLALASLCFGAAVRSVATTTSDGGERAGPVAAVAPAPAFVVPDAADQWFRPSGRNQGTEGVVAFLADLALHDNAPLYLSDGWGRTTGSPQSDHHVSRTDSWAADLAVRGVNVPTPATRAAAARISTALGEPNWPGGNLVKTVAGYRIQVLWLVAGHFDHVHVGVRNVA